MRLHDAVRYALYVSRALGHPVTRFGAVDRNATSVVTNSAIKLVSSILGHGFNNVDGRERFVRSHAVVKLMDMIMNPAPFDAKRKADGNVNLERDIRAFWRQMQVRSVEPRVVVAICEILKKFYVGANMQVHRDRPPRSDGSNPEQAQKARAAWAAWAITEHNGKTKEKLAKEELAHEFDDLLLKLGVDLGALGAKGSKRAASARGDGKGTRKKAKEQKQITVKRWESYEDTVIELARSRVPILYVRAKPGLTGHAICSALVPMVKDEEFVFLCDRYVDGTKPGKLSHYDGEGIWEATPGDYDLTQMESAAPILVVQNYGSASGFKNCCKFWYRSLKGKLGWTFIAVGATDESSDVVVEMVRDSTVVVGGAPPEAHNAKKMVKLPTVKTRLRSSTQSVLRTYSNDISFSNAPMLNRLGGSNGPNPLDDSKVLETYVNCATAELTVEASGERETQELSDFVLRVAMVKDWKDKLDTLVDLAFQANVHLVTTPAQAEAIEGRYRQRESERAATEDNDAPAATGENGKKRKSKKGSSEGADAATRVTSYEDVLSPMVEEA